MHACMHYHVCIYICITCRLSVFIVPLCVHTMDLVLFGFFFLHLVLTGSPTTIIVNTSNHLERLLCDCELNNNEVNLLILNTSITHRIRSGKFCTVNIRHSLTITSSSSDTLAHIICVSNNKTQYDKYWTRGFAFHGSRGLLTFSGLKFSNCGTNLTTLHKNLINHTNSIHFTQYHAAVLVFTDIASTTVHNVSIVDYNGFAIVAVNLLNAFFNFLLVANGQSIELEAIHNISIGSGMLVLFYNQSQVVQKNYSKYKLNIINSTFDSNVAFDQYWNRWGLTCVTGVYDKFHSRFPIINAAGITILYAQQDKPANVAISQTNFYQCNGYFGGAVLLIRFDSNFDSQTVIDGSNFSNNSIIQKCRGAAIASFFIFKSLSCKNYTYQPLTVTNTIIAENGQPYLKGNVWSSGAIYIFIVCRKPNLPIKFIFRKVSFYHNIDQYHGAGMSVNVIPNSERSTVNFLMESIEAHHNPYLNLYRTYINAYLDLPSSIFFFRNIDQLVINGSAIHPCNFSQNYGSVFEIVKSTVVLQGYLFFLNNTAYHGPALRLLENSLVYLQEGLNATFANNKAKSLGGAIYAAGKLFTKDPCTFQLYSKNYKNIVMSFINNVAALAGNAIYSQKIYNANCYIKNTTQSTTRIYRKLFKNIESTDISSFGDTIIVCDKKYAYEVYPGVSLQIPIRIIDSNYNPTYGVLTVSAVVRTKDGLKDIDWFFSDNRDTYSSIIKGTNSCTYINFSLHATALGKHNRRGTILFSISNPNKVFGVRVTLKKCPPGFRLHPVKGACVCLNHFAALVNQHSNRKELVCDIDNNAFNRPYPYLWVGASNNSLCYSLNCHPGYCNVYSHLDMLRFNDTGSYVTSLHKDLQPLCHGSRTGDICGECIPNYSVVFGSTDCKICSDKRWLLTGIIYIVAGPLLVFILYKLNLTLTKGTLNGIILYAQITNAGVQSYLNTPCSDCNNESYFIKFMSLFISWLNLNLGFPLCFYDGMNELQKAGLTLLFPIYLLFIIGLLIILSRFSTAVSNHLSKSSVQVLVTVVHLSFTQLLQAVLAVFGSAEVFIENENDFSKKVVWYCNGSTVYASTEHQWLMVITSVVVGLILIPYMAIILFGKQLMKFDNFREYIRPFIEAIYAPYKDNMWYWFALNQVYVLLAYVFDTMSALKYSFSSVFFKPLFFLFNQVFFMSQTCFSPFKNKLLNGLNFYLVINLITVYYTATYYYHHYPKAVVTFVSISVCPSILIFSLIVTFHILQVTNKLNNLFQLFETFKYLCRRQAGRVRPTNHENRATFNYRNIQDSGDYAQAREPLLECIST